MIRYPSGEQITVPRHIPTRNVRTIDERLARSRLTLLAPVLRHHHAPGRASRCGRRSSASPARRSRGCRRARARGAGAAALHDRLRGEPWRGRAQGRDQRQDVYGLTAAAIASGAIIAASKGFKGRGGLAPSQAFEPAVLPQRARAASTSTGRSSPSAPSPGRGGRVVAASRSACRPRHGRTRSASSRAPAQARPAARPAASRSSSGSRPRAGAPGGPGHRSLRELRPGRRPRRRPLARRGGRRVAGRRRPSVARRVAFAPRTPPASRPGSAPRTGRRCGPATAALDAAPPRAAELLLAKRGPRGQPRPPPRRRRAWPRCGRRCSTCSPSTATSPPRRSRAGCGPAPGAAGPPSRSTP